MMNRSVRRTLCLPISLLALCLIAATANPQGAQPITATKTPYASVRWLAIYKVEPSPAVAGRSALLSFSAGIAASGDILDRDLSALRVNLNQLELEAQVSVERTQKSDEYTIAYGEYGRTAFSVIHDASAL
jgi:hypothetical protein